MGFHLCTYCVMPSTKPDLHFDDHGVCSACRSYLSRARVDWDERKRELKNILTKYRQSSSNNWNCIVPVSGGKDSTYQVIKMLELGMTPLCVNASTCQLTEIGRRNLENLKELGVDVLEFSPSPLIRRKLNRLTLEQVGDITWPEHVSIFTIPVRVAVQYKIPLIIWGENSQHEYGGPAGSAEKNYLDRRWLEEFGGLLGLRVSDLKGLVGIQEKDLLPYTYPTDADLKEVGVTGLFLGHYLPWDGWTNTLVAQNYGWEAWPSAVEGSALSYENLDNYLHGIHDYFKFLKYGFARATDHVCMQIRRGRLSRDEGLKIVQMRDGQFPSTYLDKPISDILKPYDLTVEAFTKICDRFTNRKIFKRNVQGELLRNAQGTLMRIDPEPWPHQLLQHPISGSA